MTHILVSLPLLAAGLPAQPAREWVEKGMDQFIAGRIEESVKSFDLAAKADPDAAPHLWQRGIAYYYLGRFEEGRAQFETHRLVNPNDVENAAWWYVCMSRLGRRKEAERMLLPVGPDDRVPMAEVYALYAGKGDARAVLQAIERIGRNERERKAALFYGHLYLGLFAEANGEIKRAREHIQKAFDQRVGGYMWEVARIHLDRMPKK